jgi:hypothetical protein
MPNVFDFSSEERADKTSSLSADSYPNLPAARPKCLEKEI